MHSKFFVRPHFWLRRWFGLLAIGAIAAAGCTREPKPPQFKVTQQEIDGLPERIDKIVDDTLHRRTLNTSTHNAWQIVHGILPYGRQFQILHDGQRVGALDWILAGNQLNGWELRKGEKGIIAVLRPGSNAAQGHPDQWIGYLSQCGVMPDDKLFVNGQEYTFNDLIEQSKWDITPNMEASWTLMAFATWLPIDAQWTSKDGQTWNLERIIELESVPVDEVSNENSSCGGTHRLSAITIALKRYMDETGTPPEKLTGGWKKAYDLLYGKDGCVHRARAYQQGDGSFSANFFMRPGSSLEIDDILHSTGHTLEWLAVALPPERLQEPWVTAGVIRLCELLEDNADRDLNVGGLYHAARGLKLYRQQRFGPRNASNTAESPAAGNAQPQSPETSDTENAEAETGEKGAAPRPDSAPVPPT